MAFTARKHALHSRKNPHQEIVIKHHSRICETSCFANCWIVILQQAVARLVYLAGRPVGQQLVAQKVCL